MISLLLLEPCWKKICRTEKWILIRYKNKNLTKYYLSIYLIYTIKSTPKINYNESFYAKPSEIIFNLKHK